MKQDEVYSDNALLQKIIANDEEAFVLLYRRYNRSIFAFILKFVHNSPLAEDLTQEVFIKIWESRDGLSEVRIFKSYLFTMARNHTLNCMKKAFRSEIAMGVIVNDFISQRNATEENLLHAEYLAFINRVLNSLPDRTRTVFRMCREKGMTYDDVALDLGISRNTVKNHMVTSMKVLAAAIKNELGLSISVFLAIFHFL